MFSVIISLYNKAHTIERTLFSVLNQTFQKFEIIIVNDGSTDNGVEVINSCTSDSRVKIINQENQGVSSARNNGVANARYDYLAFLDGDDEWMPTYLEHVHKMINLYPNAGMYCTAGIVRSNGYDHFRLARKYKNQILKIDYFQSPFVFSHTSATTIAKRYFNRTNGFPPGVRNFQDFYLFTSIALISQVIYCGLPLSIYCGGVEEQATSITSFSSKLEFRVGYLNKFTKVYIKNRNKQLIIWLKAFARNEIWFMLRSAKHENIKMYIAKMEQITRKKCLGLGRIFYPNKNLYLFSMIYITIRKSLYILRGYPRLELEKGKIKTLK